MRQRPKTLHHQAGADQKNDRDRHLRHGQAIPQMAVRGTRDAMTLFERLSRTGAPRSDQRTQSEENPRRQRNRCREHQHSRVSSHPRGTRQVGRQMRSESASRRQRQQKSRGSADGRQQQTLCQQLLCEAPAACTERDPNRHLCLARRCPAQQKVRDVRAGDQQHQSNGAK